MWHSLWFLCHVLESNLSIFGFGNTTGVARNNFPILLSQRKKSWSCEQTYQGFAEAVPKNCLTLITLTLNKSAIFWSICVWELFEYEEGKFVFEHSEDSWLESTKTVISHLKFDEFCCLSRDTVRPSTFIVKFYTLITSLLNTIKFLLTFDFWFVNMLCITANKGCKSSGLGHQEISWWFGGYYSIFC